MQRVPGGTSRFWRGTLGVSAVAVLIWVWVSWRVDRSPPIDEAIGGETRHEGLRRVAGTLSSLGSIDTRVVVLAIVLTGLVASRRHGDALYVIAVVNTVHVVERILKGVEGRWRPVDPEAGYFLSDALRLVVIAAVVAGAGTWWLIRRRSIWRLVIVAGIATVLHLLSRLAVTIDVPERTDSFPSGHAANSMALAASLLMIWRPQISRRATAALVTTAITSVTAIGWSRVALGYHHPTDVIGGWALAVAIAVALDGTRRLLQRRHVGDPEARAHEPIENRSALADQS